MSEADHDIKIFSEVAKKLHELPVREVVDDVLQSVESGKVTILTGETGSGKTLLANAMLADSTDEQVVVLVPRRFLAMNAAEAIAEIGGLELGQEVGYAIGSQGKDESKFTEGKTKLLFATYGYAISSGLIDTAPIITMDEVHESGADTSLARAILHRRMKTDPNLRVIEMSATLEAEKQANYWRDISEVDMVHAEGKSFDCEKRYVHPTESKMDEIAINLMVNEDRKGLLVFLPGVGEVEKAADEIQKKVSALGLKVEVATIYGDMSGEEREEALKPPKPGYRKVLCGTNVLESGMNIAWADTAISDGTGRIPYDLDNGARALRKLPLAQWRLIQQEGRVKRFSDGIMVLYANENYEERPKQQGPEIERISLNDFALSAAGYRIDPTELKLDGNVKAERLEQAKAELQRLGMINNQWELTDKGEYARRLPLGPEAAALIYAAPPEIRDYAIQLAAILDVGGLRADYKEGHGKDNTSDVFDSLKAFRELGWEATNVDCEALNVSVRKYRVVCDLILDIHDRLGLGEGEQRKATFEERQLLMLEAGVNRLFKQGAKYLDLIRGTRDHEEGRSTNVSNNDDPFAVGYPREIPTRDGPITIMQNITKIPHDVFVTFALQHEEVLQNIHVGKDKRGTVIKGNYFGHSAISIPVGDEPSPDLQALLERAIANGPPKAKLKDASQNGVDDKIWPPEGATKLPQRSSPKGLGNTHVEELRQPSPEREVA